MEPIQYTLGKLPERSVLINVMKAGPNVCHTDYNIDKLQLQVCRDYTDLNTFNTDRPTSLSLCPTPLPVAPPRLCLLPSAVAFSFCAKVPDSIYPYLCSVALAVSPKTSPISSKLSTTNTHDCSKHRQLLQRAANLQDLFLSPSNNLNIRYMEWHSDNDSPIGQLPTPAAGQAVIHSGGQAFLSHE